MRIAAAVKAQSFASAQFPEREQTLTYSMFPENALISLAQALPGLSMPSRNMESIQKFELAGTEIDALKHQQRHDHTQDIRIRERADDA